MVFKVFCDINVSNITCESFNKDENIYYEIIPKYDDDKENWDPNKLKKNNSVTVSVGSETPSKNGQKQCKLKGEKETENKETSPTKENCAKENIIKEKALSKRNSEKENIINKESEVSTKIKNEKIKEVSKSFAIDTTELKEENIESTKDTESIVKTKEILLGKRQRIPLEDITYLFVQDRRTLTPKRVRIIKDEQEKMPETKSVKAVKIQKSSKENKESLKSKNVLSENSKENKQPVSSIPLRNISNCSNININNSNNIKYSSNAKKLEAPKPFFIDVKKSKTNKRILILKKLIK